MNSPLSPRSFSVRASLAGVSGTSGFGTSCGSVALSFPAPSLTAPARRGSGTAGGKKRSPGTSVAAERNDSGSVSSSKSVCILFVDSIHFSFLRLRCCSEYLSTQEIDWNLVYLHATANFRKAVPSSHMRRTYCFQWSWYGRSACAQARFLNEALSSCGLGGSDNVIPIWYFCCSISFVDWNQLFQAT